MSFILSLLGSPLFTALFNFFATGIEALPQNHR
jgi:hypothetical protein